MCIHVRVPQSLLRTGCLAAHQPHCLMLLGSPPDMVHSRRSRKTHSSTQRKENRIASQQPSFRDTTPAIADFRYRVPLPPRLVWPYFAACLIIFSIPHLPPFCNSIWLFFCISRIRTARRAVRHTAPKNFSSDFSRRIRTPHFFRAPFQS